MSKSSRDEIHQLTLEKGNVKSLLQNAASEFDRVALLFGVHEYTRIEFKRQVEWILADLDGRWYSKVHEIMEKESK